MCLVIIRHLKRYNEVKWEYLDAEGNRRTAGGVYLICDGGYLRWLILICPYRGSSAGSTEGYFSANIESVRKDGESYTSSHFTLLPNFAFTLMHTFFLLSPLKFLLAECIGLEARRHILF
jgi:hypothetical protein